MVDSGVCFGEEFSMRARISAIFDFCLGDFISSFRL